MGKTHLCRLAPRAFSPIYLSPPPVLLICLSSIFVRNRFVLTHKPLSRRGYIDSHTRQHSRYTPPILDSQMMIKHFLQENCKIYSEYYTIIKIIFNVFFVCFCVTLFLSLLVALYFECGQNHFLIF